MTITRREVLSALTLSGASALLVAKSDGILASQVAAARQSSPAPVFAGKHTVKPLPFSPAKLKGLSERMIVSHHDNNYAGAVKRLNLIEEKIASIAKDAPPFVLGSLKREELIAANSMVLHELYFAGLGGDGKAGGPVTAALTAAYGALAAWESEFRALGLSLAGGSGWVLLGYNKHEQMLRNYWASDHTVNPAGCEVVLLMDMYEHAYAIDYGSDARSYIDAFFRNIRWEEVNLQFEAVTRRAQ